MIKHNHSIILMALIFLGMASTVRADAEMQAASGVAETQNHQNRNVYATVNGEQITVAEYNAELITLLKNRYYHGQVPADKVEETRKELTDTMVERKLLTQEAEKRGIKPDEAAINKAIAKWESRGKLKGADHDQMVAQIRDIEGKRSQIIQLEDMIRNSVPEPAEDEVKTYYDQHLDLFTEPEKFHLSVMLVSVDPSSPVSAWVNALQEARGINIQLREGADFAELARNVSKDKSAANGGDLGYLHRGMLPRGLEDKIDSFKIGEIVEPIKMLEGMAVFRLNGKIPPNKMEFDQVKDRAKALLIRDLQAKAKKDNIERLRSQAKIEIFAPAAIATKQP